MISLLNKISEKTDLANKYEAYLVGKKNNN